MVKLDIIVEEVYGEVIKGLKEDMEIEVENLKLLYEEDRMNGVDKIKDKYSKFTI
jgi:hypothetical protein